MRTVYMAGCITELLFCISFTMRNQTDKNPWSWQKFSDRKTIGSFQHM